MSRVAALRDRRVLVLGASGFIGRWVAGALEREGCAVVLVVRDPAAARAALEMAGVSTKPVQADLTDLEELGRLVRDARPEITFNLVGYGVDRAELAPDLARRINAELPGRLAELLLEERRGDDPPGLIHTGSALEYGVAQRVGEDDPAEPMTDYGRTKLAGTRAIGDKSGRGLRGVTARLFNVYGPGEHAGRLLPCLLEAAASGQAVELTEGRQRHDFTYIDDVVEGLVRLAACPEPPDIVNLATGRLTSVREFVEAAAHVLRLEPDQLRLGARPGLAEEMTHEPVPVGRLREAVGWTPGISTLEGIRRTVRVLAGEMAT